MTRKRLFAGAVLLGLLVVAASQAVWADAGGGSYFVGNVRNSPVVIPAAAFRGAGAGATDSYFISIGGYIAGRDGYSTGCVFAPVYLPDGVTLTSAFAYVYDNSTTFRIIMNLVRTRITNLKPVGYVDSTENVYTFETTTNSGEIRSIGGSLDPGYVVNYPGDQYFLETCLGDEDIRIYSVRVYFE